MNWHWNQWPWTTPKHALVIPDGTRAHLVLEGPVDGNEDAIVIKSGGHLTVHAYEQGALPADLAAVLDTHRVEDEALLVKGRR